MTLSKPVNLPYIPQELLIKILLRLPFESILSFKLVSKQWKNLINDPDLINRYNNKSLALFVDQESLYGVLTTHGSNNTTTVGNAHCHPPFRVRRIEIEFKHVRSLFGSSNGMACVQATDGHLLLYNLFTGAFYTIPHAYETYSCYGFGYDRHADDYNVVVVYRYHWGIKTLQKEDNTQFWVYSLKNRVWKPLFGFPYNEYNWSPARKRPACFLNGVLHWFVPRKGNIDNEVIVTYDLHTCGFGEISTVPVVDCFFWVNLSELGGKLCCSWIHKGVTLNVWVMEEYGVKESWTMLVRISQMRMRLHNFTPLEVFECRDGRKVVLFVCPYNGLLCWYDIDNDDVEIVPESEYLEEKVGNWRKKRKISLNGD